MVDVWEKNGNVVVRGPPASREKGYALRAMVDSDQTSQNISCFDSDWNSNQFLGSKDQKSSFFEQYSNIKDNANKDYYRKSSQQDASSPVYALQQKDLSYDDLSKNIDANLAEIDMETFRSEDIHSILALPAIFSGDFNQSSNQDGEQCASVSGSMLDGMLDGLDASTRSNRQSSEDEISLIRDEPLFSPLREPASISVDSLDNSFEQQDLVLTCKANKDNYTIVFEGSASDSDYQDPTSSSSATSSRAGMTTSGSMAQSDAALTTWGKLWRSQRASAASRTATPRRGGGGKSRSLPNLSQAVLITDKQLSQWARWCGHHHFPLHELVRMGGAGAGREGLHSISLLKLFMQHKVASKGGCTESATSLIMQPLRNGSLQNSMSVSAVSEEKTTTDMNRLDNWQETNNNNNLNSLYHSTAAQQQQQQLQNDNSQYLEDSLMDPPPAQQQPPFRATPIKEEEETSDVSSGDEVMHPFGSDESSSAEVTVIQKEDQPQEPASKKSTESQATQTLQPNINDCPLRPCGGGAGYSNKSSGIQTTDCEGGPRRSSRDSSPASSGYVSSRHSSVERHPPSNVVTQCTCGTQIPVHVKDESMQTVGLADCSSSGFTLKESTTVLPEPNITSPQTASVRLMSQSNVGSQTATGKARSSSSKEKKSIYVCYPNYSLPDLSFLKSVIEENSESVFLAPTEFRPAPPPTATTRRRPKSYTAYEVQKHLTRIKDWDSLNVLLPEDLRQLISKTKGEMAGAGEDGSKPRGILRKSSSSNSSSSTEEQQQQLIEEEQKSKAVKFCERSPTKSVRQQLLEECKSGRCCSCESKTPESEKPPQEFLVSPTQNTLPYPDISDSYTLQNFSGGGKFFQEALRRKTGLVENLRKAVQIIFEHHKNTNKKGMELSYSLGQKILTCLCPAIHTILSDGLLPSVQGFFGPLPNSPWKVAGASIKQGETRKDVEELLNHVTAEKLLTDSTYKFNAFILGLLNLGCFEWWLGHLCGCQSLVCHHYHPTALLSLLALPAAVHLRHELKELVSPLSALPLPHPLDILLETRAVPPSGGGAEWKKYDEGNCRAKMNDLCGVKSKVMVASPCSNVMNIHEEENMVWPGITINPFPNAEFSTKKERNTNNHPHTRHSPPRGEDCSAPPHPPLFSLCSSTDSGCSSQIIQEHNSPNNNINNADEEAKDTHQFKMLRQKWEKMAAAKTAPKAAPKAAVAPPANKKKQMMTEAPKTPTKTPPARRARVQVVSPEAPPGERRSQIPTPKFAKPKSMIPTVAKGGLSRARSANRDARFPSD